MSDVNYRLHEKLSDVADLKVREAMDAIVAVVQIEVATAHGEGEKCARAEEAAKYKAVVEAAQSVIGTPECRFNSDGCVDCNNCPITAMKIALAALEEGK